MGASSSEGSSGTQRVPTCGCSSGRASSPATWRPPFLTGARGTLEWLYDAGVHVSLEEFKGYATAAAAGARPGSFSADDFDNPLAPGHYEARSGGSGGAARACSSSLDLLEHESAYHTLFFTAAGVGLRADRHLASGATGRGRHQDRADSGEAQMAR